MDKQERKRCTEEVFGKISNFQIKGLNHPSVISVEYTAGGKTYVLEETVKLKSVPIKIWFLTIGQRRVPTISRIKVGQKILVKYNQWNPHYAYLPDNVGLTNV